MPQESESDVCKGFNADVAAWYSGIKRSGEESRAQPTEVARRVCSDLALLVVQMELVFVSSDKDTEGFQRSRAGMPWPALPLGDELGPCGAAGLISLCGRAEARGIANSLASNFGVDKIPRLVIIDGNTGTLKEHMRSV